MVQLRKAYFNTA